jgi:hypothetical protein
MELSFVPLILSDPRISAEAREALALVADAPSERHAKVARARAARLLMAAYDLTCPEVSALF